MYKIKVCQVCGKQFTPNSSRQKYCMKCRRKQYLKVSSEYHRKRNKAQPGYYNRWNKAHPEYTKKWFKEHPGYFKQWDKKHPELAKLHHERDNARRRQFGSIPLNKPFTDSEGHHIDLQHVIHIPKEIHRSVSHNLLTGKNIDAINNIAYTYL